MRQYKEKESDDVKISLSYKNEQVGNSLSVMTVRLANNGKKDIAFNQVFEDKIQIKLKNAEILDIQIEKQSDKVSASVEKSDSLGWLLSWGILKKKEIIVLKIVSVYPKEVEEENVNLRDLMFVFRGNNLNEIEPINSQKDRSFIWAVIIACLILLGTITLLPSESVVQYNVVVNGELIQDAHISYNGYTQKYIIKKRGGPVIKTTEIQNISVTKQPRFSSEVIVSCIVAIVYLTVIIFMLIYCKRRNKTLFYSLFKFMRD